MSSHQPLHVVLINEEEQYSLWTAGREVPSGWKMVGEPDTREACLARINQVWTDMRPLSLRQQMASRQR